MTTTLEQAAQKIEAALKTLETNIGGFLKDTVEPALDAEFTALKPQVLGLGETMLSQVWTAAETYLGSGGSITDAIAALVAQLPADLQALEHLVASAFGAAVQSIAAKAVAAAGP